MLKHDYMHAELVVRAVEDFLAGPGALDPPMDALHREISALAAAYAPERPASAVGMPPFTWRPPRSRVWRPLSLLGGMAALLLGLVRPKLRPDLLFVDQWHPWATMRVGQYGLSDRMRSYVQVYRYDRDRLRRGLRRGLAAVLRYRRERRGGALARRAPGAVELGALGAHAGLGAGRRHRRGRRAEREGTRPRARRVTEVSFYDLTWTPLCGACRGCSAERAFFIRG